MIQLPKILDQGNIGGCASFAVAGLANYYLKQQGINDEIDGFKLYSENLRGIEGSSLIRLLSNGKVSGLPSIKGKRYKVKSIDFVSGSVSSIDEGLKKNGGLVFSYNVMDGDPFHKRIDKKFNLRVATTSHAMVIVGCDEENKRYKIANSWGAKFGEKGYFYIPFVLMNKKYLEAIYSFSI